MAENMVHIPMKRPSGTDAVLDHEGVSASPPPIEVMPTKRAKLDDQNKEMNQEVENIHAQVEHSANLPSPEVPDHDEPSSDILSNSDIRAEGASGDIEDEVDYNEDEDDEEDFDEDQDDEQEHIYNESEDEYEEDYDDDEFEEPKYEVEELDHILSTELEQIFKLKLYVSKEEEFEEWLETIQAKLTHNGKDIGFAVARYIHRERIRPNFWRDMEEPSQDMSSLAFGVFDRYGYLRIDLKEHSVRRGTGVWGSELDYGRLFLIEHIEITDKDWRRKGLGRLMVNALLQKAQRRERPEPHRKLHETFASLFSASSEILQEDSNFHLNVLAIPGSLTRHVEQDARGKSKREKYEIGCQAFDTAVAFWRSLGFRRIGASSCLGFSFDPTHKSKSLSITDDFDLPFVKPEGWDDDSDDEIPSFDDARAEMKRKEKLAKLKATHPLHHATLSLSDDECVEFYKAFVPKDVAGWKQVDHSLDTVLHVAARQLKLHSIEWLMGHACEELISARDKNGYTPLESLRDYLEVERTQLRHGFLTVNVSDRFSGFSPEVTACLCMLSGLGNINTLSNESLRLKYGCTCGKCFGGFVSPRMKLALVFQAEMIHDLLDSDIDDGPYWCDWNEDVIVHVDQNIQRNFRTNKSLRQGFANIFNYIASCLNSQIVPTRENVLQELQTEGEWPPVTRNYLERGGTIQGKVEAALRVVFKRATEQDEKFGDGEMEAVMGTELSQLQTCRNDNEYGFVASECGAPYGNYY